MKRTISYLLSFVLMLVLTGCEPEIKSVADENSTLVTGILMRDGSPLAGEELRIYTIIDLELAKYIYLKSVTSDSDGSFETYLPKDEIYSIEAGVSPREWNEGLGQHGAALIDLTFPELGRDIEIVLRGWEE